MHALKLTAIALAALTVSGCFVTRQEVQDRAYADCKGKGGGNDVCLAIGYRSGAEHVERIDRAFQGMQAAAAAMQQANYYYNPPTVRVQTTCMRVGYMVTCN